MQAIWSPWLFAHDLSDDDVTILMLSCGNYALNAAHKEEIMIEITFMSLF